MAEVIGRALIRILPQTAEFAVFLRRDLNRIVKTVVDSLATLGTQAAAGGVLALGGVVSNLSGSLALIPAAVAGATAAIGALAVGFQGFGKAVKDAGDPKKFSKDLAKLSPEAQKAAIAIRDLGVQAGTFKKTVQDSLFQGIGPAITKLATQLLPSVQKGFLGITTEVNSSARAVALFAGSKQTVADLNTIFANVKTTLRQSLTPAALAVGSAFRDIATVGSSFLPLIGQALSGAAEKFAAFVAKARDSGQLTEFIARGVATFQKLFDVLKNLVQAIGSVFHTAQDAGAGFLDVLDKGAQALNAFVHSAEGKEAILSFISSAKDAGLALLPVLKAAVLLFADEIAPILAEIGKVVGPAVTVFIGSLTQALRTAAPGIIALAQGFANLVQGLAPALPALGRLASVLGQVLGQVLTRLAPVLERVVVVIADALTKALTTPGLVDSLVAMGQAFADLFVALAPLIPPLTRLAVVILTALAKVLEKIGPPLADLIGKFIDALLPVLPGLIDAFLQLVDAMLPIVKTILPPMLELMRVLLPVLKPILQIIGLLLRLITPLIQGLGVVIEMLVRILQFAGAVIGALVKVFEFLGEKIFNHSLRSLVDYVNALADSQPKIISIFGAVAEATRTFGGIFQGVMQAAQQATADTTGAAEKMQHGIAGAFDGTVKSAEDFVQQLIDILFPNFDSLGAAGSAAFGDVSAGAQGAFGQIVDGVKGMINDVKDVLNGTNFGPAGSALTQGLAAGMVDARARLAIEKAARQVAETIAAWFPHSPAKVGPFSGDGWTPFRGRALVDGFAQGIESGTATLNAALNGLFSGVAAGASGGTSAPNLPLRVGAFGISGSTSAGGSAGGAAASAGVAAGDATEVHVFIGDQELTQLVQGVVVQDKRRERRQALAGTGRAR